MKIRMSVLPVAGMTTLLVGCSHSIAGAPHKQRVEFDATKMAQDIQREATQNGVPLADVVCPEHEVAQRGRTFDCVAGDRRIHITVTSDRGDYTWQVSPR